MNDDDKEQKEVSSESNNEATGEDQLLQPRKARVQSEATSADSKGPTDTGAEEFSEKIYDDNAPTPDEFDEPHSVSPTGSELK